MSAPESSLYIWDGFLLYSAFETVNTFHSHYAASIVIATEARIRVEDEDGARTEFDAVLIPPNFPHRLSAIGTNVLVLQIDPDYDEFEALRGRAADRPHDLGAQIPDELKRKITGLRENETDCAAALDLFHEVLRAAGGQSQTRPPRLDERVSRILEHLRELEELPEDISTGEMARLVDLSEDRLRTVFKEHMGLPFRRYLLWQRLRRAALLIGEEHPEMTLTEAAHAAGFYDSAHFSRTFREMFGHAPSALLGARSGPRVFHC